MPRHPEWPSLRNPPLINVRTEFNTLLGLFRNLRFRDQFKGFQGKPIPIRTHYFTWHGRAGTLLSYLLRDSIVGLEASVSGAVQHLCGDSGPLTPAVRRAILDPFTLGTKGGTAGCVYNGLPSLVDRNFAMGNRAPELWSSVAAFYEIVRNPLFHSSELADDEVDRFLESLEVLWRIYEWLNGWYPIEKLMEGPIAWSPQYIERVASIPMVETGVVDQFAPRFAMDDEYRADASQLPEGLDLIAVASVNGLYVPSSELVQLSMAAESGQRIQMELSPNSAMRLLAFLASAQIA